MLGNDAIICVGQHPGSEAVCHNPTEQLNEQSHTHCRICAAGDEALPLNQWLWGKEFSGRVQALDAGDHLNGSVLASPAQRDYRRSWPEILHPPLIWIFTGQEEVNNNLTWYMTASYGQGS